MNERSRTYLDQVGFKGHNEPLSQRPTRKEAPAWASLSPPLRHSLLRPQGILGSTGNLEYTGGRSSSYHNSTGYGSTPNGSGQRSLGGSFTPPSGNSHLTNVTEMTRHLSLAKLKDVTKSLISGRSREITFTLPPTVSPLSPRRGFGDMGLLSPMSSPRRHASSSDEVVHMRSQAAPDVGAGDSSRTTTPSPSHGKLFFLDSSPFPGACSLGAINPDLYKEEDLEDNLVNFPEDHLGRVWFRVDYEADAEKLKVNLLRAKHLPSRTPGLTNCCDPFVRLHLMPDERRYLQTKVKRKTCDPRFDEVFVFQVTAKELRERALKITFFDVNRDKRHKAIGHVLFLLKDIKSNMGKIQMMDISKEYTLSPLEVGELQVSLCYNDNLERLTITVGDTRNLKIPENIRQYPMEFQARVALMQQAKVVKSKKTEVVRSDKSPSFNESFIFKVPAEQLDVTAISISVSANKKSDATLGRVLLGPFMFARGKANDHWAEMVSRKREHIQMWHSIS